MLFAPQCGQEGSTVGAPKTLMKDMVRVALEAKT
jgi:hypothetical protein